MSDVEETYEESVESDESDASENESDNEQKSNKIHVKSSFLSKEEVEMGKNTEKRSLPFLDKFERSRLIATRARQLASDCPALVDTTGMTDVEDIAEKEIKEGVIPIIIRRILPNGDYEDWSITDFR